MDGWLALKNRHSPLPRAHVPNQLKTQLQAVKKGSSSIFYSLQNIKTLIVLLQGLIWSITRILLSQLLMALEKIKVTIDLLCALLFSGKNTALVFLSNISNSLLLNPLIQRV